MSSSPILPRLLITLVCILAGAGLGAFLQVSRMAKKPQEFRSLAKLVAGGQMVFNDSVTWREQQQDFYGTIIETVESEEMKRRALDRVRALNPDLETHEVSIRVAQTKGSAIFNILATGSDPKFTKIFLDALLEEFIAFRQNIREQAQGRTLQQFLQEVVTRQKQMEDSMAALEKAHAKVDSLSLKSDLERVVARLNTLRDKRDDLRLELKSLAATDATRAPLEARLTATEQEVQSIETELQRREPDLAELRVATERFTEDKMTYEKLFEQVEKLQTIFNMQADYVAIQERATPAAENVEDWVTPVAMGAVAGGLLCGLIGLVLSLILVRAPKPPQMPTAVG